MSKIDKDKLPDEVKAIIEALGIDPDVIEIHVAEMPRHVNQETDCDCETCEHQEECQAFNESGFPEFLANMLFHNEESNEIEDEQEFVIPVTQTVFGYARVKASNLQEAMDTIENHTVGIELLKDCVLIPGSTTIVKDNEASEKHRTIIPSNLH